MICRALRCQRNHRCIGAYGSELTGLGVCCCCVHEHHNSADKGFQGTVQTGHGCQHILCCRLHQTVWPCPISAFSFVVSDANFLSNDEVASALGKIEAQSTSARDPLPYISSTTSDEHCAVVASPRHPQKNCAGRRNTRTVAKTGSHPIRCSTSTNERSPSTNCSRHHASTSANQKA